MAEVTRVKAVTAYRLTLSPEEAGYLLDLLSAHVGGELTYDENPLGTIRVALRDAEVERKYANRKDSGRPYAVLNL